MGWTPADLENLQVAGRFAKPGIWATCFPPLLVFCFSLETGCLGLTSLAHPAGAEASTSHTSHLSSPKTSLGALSDFKPTRGASLTGLDWQSMLDAQYLDKMGNGWIQEGNPSTEGCNHEPTQCKAHAIPATLES